MGVQKECLRKATLPSDFAYVGRFQMKKFARVFLLYICIYIYIEVCLEIAIKEQN